jgi:phage repressor protein C with HTH and peptisase S24 domain
MSESSVLIETHLRCVAAHRQGVIGRDYRENRVACDSPHMAEGFDIAAIRASIETLMSRDGIKRKPLAKAAGLGETAIRDIFNPDRQDVKASTLIKLAEFFDVSVDEIAGRGPVPLLGKIGAGGAILFEDTEDVETVPRPPLGAGRLMALEVVGESMLPKYEAGDVIYVRRDHDGVLPAYLGDYCAVSLVDGGTFLKILSPGSKPGCYTLRSLNAADMENVEVAWASPVLFVMPRRSRARP